MILRGWSQRSSRCSDGDRCLVGRVRVLWSCGRAWPSRWRYLRSTASTYRAPAASTGLDGPRHSCEVFCPPATTPEGIDAWLSLRDVLPTLAEAAPGMFLDALEATLQSGEAQRSPVVASLHTTIVWSLEKIAWGEDYFARSIYALAALDEGSAGENTETAAMQKLVGMLFPWRPVSSVPQEARLQVLDGLRVRHPDCAWRLLMNLLQTDGLIMETERPLSRDQATEHPTFTKADLAAFTSEIARRAAETLGTDTGRVVEAIESLEHLAPGASLNRCSVPSSQRSNNGNGPTTSGPRSPRKFTESSHGLAPEASRTPVSRNRS